MAISRVQLAVVLVLTSFALGCGDNDNSPRPQPTLTPATFQCTGPEGPPTTCHEGSSCCGNTCVSGSAPCCVIPEGRANAGQHFACRFNQECCVNACAQIGQCT